MRVDLTQRYADVLHAHCYSLFTLQRESKAILKDKTIKLNKNSIEGDGDKEGTLQQTCRVFIS